MDSVLGDCWRCQEPAKGIKCDKCHIAEYCGDECRHKDRFNHQLFCQRVDYFLICSLCNRRLKEVKKCSGCHFSYYCDSTCQKNNWTVHKKVCKALQLKIKACLDDFQEIYAHLPWYIGTSMAEDYLNLRKNEGISWNATLKLLFVGLGDIRDVVRTVTDLPEEYSGKLEFVLNDFSPHIMARNIMFLYCALLTDEFNHLVQIWYSVLLTPACLHYLKSVLTKLINDKRKVFQSLNGGIDISDSNWESCKDIWEAWLKIANDAAACQEITDLRQKILACDSKGKLSLQMYYDCSPEFHKKSLKAFFEKGLFLPLTSPERDEAIHGNPTLTCFNPMKAEYNEKYPDINMVPLVLLGWDKMIPLETNMIFCVPILISVFGCWDYLQVKKNVEFNNDVIQMYTSYLEKLFENFASCVKNRHIHFRLIVDDFQRLDEYLSPEEKFDRIGTSNLCDYYPTSLLDQFSSRLNNTNEYSVLICRQECWYRKIKSFYQDLPFNEETARHDIEERPEILEGLPVTKRQDFLNNLYVINDDYKEINLLFFRKILSEFLDYRHGNKKLLLDKNSIQNPVTMAKKIDIKFRDFRWELNHTIPFQREIKIRIMNLIGGNPNCRYVEWYLVPNK